MLSLCGLAAQSSGAGPDWARGPLKTMLGSRPVLFLFFYFGYHDWCLCLCCGSGHRCRPAQRKYAASVR